jgi:predicted patatin/cPLA2 family phospholipase
VLAQSCVRDYLETLRSGSIGLVLAGGGGKGAYEGGVLLALYDAGLHQYEAIAGTSVGALNAALAHQLFETKDRNMSLAFGPISRQRRFCAGVSCEPLWAY